MRLTWLNLTVPSETSETSEKAAPELFTPSIDSDSESSISDAPACKTPLTPGTLKLAAMSDLGERLASLNAAVASIQKDLPLNAVNRPIQMGLPKGGPGCGLAQSPSLESMLSSQSTESGVTIATQTSACGTETDEEDEDEEEEEEKEGKEEEDEMLKALDHLQSLGSGAVGAVFAAFEDSEVDDLFPAPVHFSNSFGSSSEAPLPGIFETPMDRVLPFGMSPLPFRENPGKYQRMPI